MTLTYNGSTVTSTASNPPNVLESLVGGHINFASSGASASTGFSLLGTTQGQVGGKLWMYSSSNTAAELAGAAAINDGVALGMAWGDIMIGVTATAYSTSPIGFLGVLVTSAGSTSFCLSSNVLTSTAV